MIRRTLAVKDRSERKRIWEFYNNEFKAVNEETPIAQSFPEAVFMSFLTNSRVIKFIAMEGSDIVGLGFITDQLDLEPLISVSYFEKHFPDQPVFYILTIAVGKSVRGSRLAFKILQLMIDEIPDNGHGLFFQSDGVNSAIHLFAERAGKGHIIGKMMDKESLYDFSWKGGEKRIPLSNSRAG